MSRGHPLSHCTILVVEDHSDARTYLGRFLSDLGANVILAEDGIDGLEAAKKNDPDLVITDLRMPRLDGFRLMEEIRALYPNNEKRIPIIAMTAFSTRVTHSRLVHSGFQACLQKPFTAEALLAAVVAALNA